MLRANQYFQNGFHENTKRLLLALHPCSRQMDCTVPFYVFLEYERRGNLVSAVRDLKNYILGYVYSNGNFELLLCY